MPSRKSDKQDTAKVSHVLRVLRAVRCDNFRIPDNRSRPKFLTLFRTVGK